MEGGIAGALAGAATGAMVGSAIPGVGTAIGAGVGAVVGFFTGVYAEDKVKQTIHDITHPGGPGISISYEGINATADDLEKDSDLLEKYHVVDDAQNQAYSELTELLAKLATTSVKYDVSMSGATGNIQLDLYGPDEILGFSAFPVKLRLYFASDPIEYNKIHLQKVTMYVVRADTGTAYYTYERTFTNLTFNGDAYDINTFLKVPDDLDYEVANALSTGQITPDLIEKLKSAKTPQFEIYVRIDAYKEDWSLVNGTWVHVRDIPLTVTAQTQSVWRHVTSDSDVVLFQTGLNASMPAELLSLAMGKFAPFIAQQWGAVSDVLIRPYSTPVHVQESTATWKFFVAPNHDFLTMFDSSPRIYDDFEVFAVRVLQNGAFEMADRRPNILGDMTTGIKEAYGAVKYTFGPDIVNYRVYALGLIWFERDDGTKIPAWVLIQPHMSVLSMEKLALDDTRLQKILPIFDDKQITELELQTLKAELESVKQDIQEKIQAAEQLKKMAEANGNTEAAEYADRAIKYYQLELQMLDQATSVEDAQLALNYLNAAKKYEYAADFEKQAADKAYKGDSEGAKALDSQAQEYKKDGDKYVPHFSVGGLANTILGNLKDWKMLLLLAVLLIGGYYLFGRMGALIGLGIWLAIVIGIPALKALVAWLGTKL
ncbi:membrane protein [Thermococcus guaymasensis DSM 11113]|uniref:Membrane protein n=1 Tax=Thermococcus guaymasensis DSM 11113 TaxID=1432656 RepID=A0A0X1KI39_9EURY|nr:membrane protein [Thermococcus guaymasensis DSM 11113]